MHVGYEIFSEHRAALQLIDRNNAGARDQYPGTLTEKFNECQRECILPRIKALHCKIFWVSKQMDHRFKLLLSLILVFDNRCS